MRATAHIYVVGRQLRQVLGEIERTSFQLRCARTVAQALDVLTEHAAACELLEQVIVEYRAALHVFHNGCKDVIEGRPRGGRP